MTTRLPAVTALALVIVASAAFAGAAAVKVDGKTVAGEAPFVRDGTTYVQVRPVCEALGAKVEWDAHRQMATITRMGNHFSLTAGKDGAYLDHNRLTLGYSALADKLGVKATHDRKAGGVITFATKCASRPCPRGA